MTSSLDDALAPARASTRLGDACAAAREALHVVEPDPGRPGGALIAAGSASVAHVASDERGARRLREEAALRDWAARAGVGVPPVTAEGPGWLLSVRLPQDPFDAAAARALVAAVARLSAAGPPPSSGGADAWRAPRRTRVVRLVRAVAGRLPVAEFRAARARVQALPHAVPSHGDLHAGNVLWDASAGALALVDFELAGLYPAGWDLVSAWVPLEDGEARQVLRDAAERVPGSGAVAHWVALRHLGDLLTGAERPTPTAVARARAVVQEARAWAGVG